MEGLIKEMLPELNILGLHISTYYLMMFLGFVFMLVLMLKRKALYDLNTGQAILFTACVMVSGVAGCKLLFILENWGTPITVSGFSFFGAVFLVPPLMALFGLMFRLKPEQSVNASAPCVNAMIGTIRVGCFLNGCCGGWATASGFRWPTQAMESVGDFVILFWLLSMGKKGDTKLYLRFMLAYGILRFFIEFLRDTPKDWLFLSHGQWFSIVAVWAAVTGLRFLKEKGSKYKTKKEKPTNYPGKERGRNNA